MPRPVDQITIADAELAPFVSGKGLASKAQGLWQQQKGVWEMLRTGSETLQSIRTKVFDFGGVQIKVQFNPGRLISTSAKVDAASIKERKCFLCSNNLPAAQRGILCDGEYLVLCNPFPIFPEHFTIPSLHHTPQLICDSFASLLYLTREMGTRYVLLYNGPRCGASAPDHLHFQAGTRSCLPIDNEYEGLRQRSGDRLAQHGSLSIYTMEDGLRRFFSLESPDPDLLQQAFGTLYEALQDGTPAAEEPMLNILGFYTNAGWRIHVFPRSRHRPSFYFKEGEDKLLISPAAVELGGLCTTPREQDFERVTQHHLREMYHEVGVSAERFARIKNRLASRLAPRWR